MAESSLTVLLQQLKERRAQTFPEKLKSLDLRDDIWRKYVEQNKNLSADIQRTGLCTDMCSERERITREFQRLYKSYELDPETRALNPALMVTEYSRAAADQAMLSPYDLRPGPVLLHTMNYLITNIMDNFDFQREQADWYNFLWDRLRAIRKELTQQHLRDEVAIAILEQCIRFHIFCSAFLSTYPRDAFDPNLNDKMLIGCLDQLHECYMTHHLQPLENLSEFTSYMLLINLKEDNESLLRIRRFIGNFTDQTDFSVALNIQRALLMNNTTKFFSLIEKKATLLQSCLLHRYFNIVRLKRLNSLIQSSRANDEVRLSDLTTILGMDNDEDTKEYLEQFEYSFTTSTPICFIVPSSPAENPSSFTNKLSQKLIKSKYKGNLKDIISGQENTPVVIADTQVENSFDLDGYFIGRLPVSLDASSSSVPNRTAVATSVPPPLPPAAPPRRPPSTSAMRSIAATTTTNTFLLRSGPTGGTGLFSNATTTVPTVPPVAPASSPFRFGGFQSQPRPNSSIAYTTTTVFAPPRFSFTSQPTEPKRVIEEPPRPAITVQVIPPTPTPTVSQPVEKLAAPVQRRLSTNSLENFLDQVYQSVIDEISDEIGSKTFNELVDDWNEMSRTTCTTFDELLNDAMRSIVQEYFSERDFHQRMIDETNREKFERKRKKYLQQKFFSIWLEKSIEAKEERAILTSLQMKYHFPTTEQLFEFLTGLQLISEHSFSIDETKEILKHRRYVKKSRERDILRLSNNLFNEFLREEFRSLAIESTDEYQQRQTLLSKALTRQNQRQREHFLRVKYFSLWLTNVRQRRKKKSAEKTTNKRLYSSVLLRTSKKLKGHHEQYQALKSSFQQINDDLQQIQSILDRFVS